MIQYNSSAYEAMSGDVTCEVIEAKGSCMSQCTGCVCSCQCSCSGGLITDFEWEEL